MDRGQYEVAREDSLNDGSRRVFVMHFADDDHVRVLASHRLNRLGK